MSVADPGGALDLARSHLDRALVGDDAGRRNRDSTLAFLDRRADALSRDCPPGHLTGSALVVAPDGSFLVMLHRKLGLWLQLGGHADGEGDLAAVALREATEESGLGGLRVLQPAVDVDVHAVDPPGEEPHDHHDVRFVVEAPAKVDPPGNPESLALRWLDEADLDGIQADDSLRRLVAVGLAAWREGQLH